MIRRTFFNDQNAVAQAIAASRTQEKASLEIERKPLAIFFVPTEKDVICARGKAASRHPGNIMFRELIQSRIAEYSSAKTKMDKSVIVSQIVEQVRQASPNGGFVKQNTDDNTWFEVGDSIAREKVGQCFRDLLHSKYRSSYQSKQKRRKEKVSETSSVVIGKKRPVALRDQFAPIALRNCVNLARKTQDSQYDAQNPKLILEPTGSSMLPKSAQEKLDEELSWEDIKETLFQMFDPSPEEALESSIPSLTFNFPSLAINRLEPPALAYS